jgi:hypothetical protein
MMVLSASILLMLMTFNAQAMPFSTDLAITGQVEFDSGNAVADGNVTQSGSLKKIEGEATTDSAFSGTTPPTTNPLTGTLTDIGDGFGIDGIDVDSVFESEFAIGIDIGIDVTNNSLTDMYKVTFQVSFNNAVDSSGTDAFADSEFTVDDPFGEVFVTDLISDPVNGDEIGGTPTGTFGDSLSGDGMAFFDLIFGPGETVIASVSGDLTLEGGAFTAGSTASADFSAFISVDNVMNLTNPPDPIPEPATLILLVTGLTGLTAIRRRRRKVRN